jgi:hypothetical protein
LPFLLKKQPHLRSIESRLLYGKSAGAFAKQLIIESLDRMPTYLSGLEVVTLFYNDYYKEIWLPFRSSLDPRGNNNLRKLVRTKWPSRIIILMN